MDSLFNDPNDPNSHYIDETDYDSKYFRVNEMSTFLNDLTQHENLSPAFKGYLRYKTITSQNVSSEAQIKNVFIS